ncbi:MAG: hypothetical protein KY468_11430 [Armatimonadetes bacterium]|nr:hypothetical protein [Armatimonadota bacterium]
MKSVAAVMLSAAGRTPGRIRWGALALGLWMGVGPSAQAAPHLRETWRKRVRPLHSFRVSPNGDALILGYRDGRSHCFHRDGKLSWGVRFKQPHRVMPSNNGQYALAFPPHQPYSTMATLLRGGKTCRRVKLDGAILSGTMSPDGQFGAAVTRKGSLYFFRRTRSCFTYTRQRLKGEPRVTLVPRTGLLLVGHAGSGGVEAYGRDGSLRWRLPGEAGRVYDLTSSPEGHAVGILSYRAGFGDRIRALVVASSGDLIWQSRVPGIYPRMALEADGVRASLGYTEVMRAGTSTGYARKVALYDGAGRRLWEKGGLFFSPQLLGTVTPGPSVVAKGGGGDLYLLDGRGGIQSQYRHPTPIRRAETSWDGRTVVLWDMENSLSYLRWMR